MAYCLLFNIGVIILGPDKYGDVVKEGGVVERNGDMNVSDASGESQCCRRSDHLKESPIGLNLG